MERKSLLLIKLTLIRKTINKEILNTYYPNERAEELLSLIKQIHEAERGSMMTTQTKNIQIFIIGVLSTLVVVLAGWVGYDKFLKPKSEKR